MVICYLILIPAVEDRGAKRIIGGLAMIFGKFLLIYLVIDSDKGGLVPLIGACHG